MNLNVHPAKDSKKKRVKKSFKNQHEMNFTTA
jgi:hypothetical protein